MSHSLEQLKIQVNPIHNTFPSLKRIGRDGGECRELIGMGRGSGGVRIGLLIGSSAHFLFDPTLILVVAVGLIINTQSNTVIISSIRGSSNEYNLIVKSTAKLNFARLVCLMIHGGSSSSLLSALFDGGVSPGATAPTLSTHHLTDFWFVVI